jgi:lipopolysaccharide export system protein LptC
VRRASNSWLPAGILLILAGTSFWLKEVVDNSAISGRGKLLHRPDLIVSKFSVHQLGIDGNTRYTLSANTMTHFADDDSSDFDKVHLASFQPGAPAMEVQSDFGRRLVNDERVYFTGHVVVTRQADKPDELPIVMHTRVLEVYPDRKLSVAREPVEMEHGADRLEADTMVFDNKLSIAEFKRAKVTLFPHGH